MSELSQTLIDQLYNQFKTKKQSKIKPSVTTRFGKPIVNNYDKSKSRMKKSSVKRPPPVDEFLNDTRQIDH